MSNDFRMTKYFIVVSTGHRLVSEEVDFFEAFGLDVTETEGFVPADWEDVKGDLTA